MRLRRVCVFCGSSHGSRLTFAQAADGLGRLLASEGIELVYGGGDVGLMGVIADAVMDAGGEVVGVIPESLVRAEVAHRGLTRLEVVPDMHVRKARMAELSDGFIALPGGLGTFEELFEQLTWRQLGLHNKATVALDIDGYFEPLFAMMRATVDEGFAKQVTLDLLRRATSPLQALEMLREQGPEIPPKWLR
ncbi:MAG: TIGR00730 family Rossman fold protein [Acidimicrobiia bacterium]